MRALLPKYFLCIPLHSAQSCVIPLGNIVRQFSIYVFLLPLHSSRPSDEVFIHRVISDGMFSAYAFAGWQWTPSANWSRCLTRFHILSEWDFSLAESWIVKQHRAQWMPLFYFYCSLKCLGNLFVAHSILVVRLVHSHFHYYYIDGFSALAYTPDYHYFEFVTPPNTPTVQLRRNFPQFSQKQSHSVLGTSPQTLNDQWKRVEIAISSAYKFQKRLMSSVWLSVLSIATSTLIATQSRAALRKLCTIVNIAIISIIN